MHRSPGTCDPAGPGESFLHYHPVQGTPIGDLAIVYCVSPFSLHRIFLPAPHDTQWRRRNAENPEGHGSGEISQIAQSIRDYLSADAAPLPVPWHRLDLKSLSPLQVQVLRATCDIPYGQTASYKAIAEAIGRPRACRFVGTALSLNPFPILIPCHRVIRSDTSPGEYGGGRQLKQWLLHMESRNNPNIYGT